MLIQTPSTTFTEVIIFDEKKHILKFFTSLISKVSVHTQEIAKMLHLGRELQCLH